MTDEELQYLKGGLEKLFSFLSRNSFDFRSITLDDHFMDALSLDGKLFQSQVQRIEAEMQKWTDMRKKFVEVVKNDVLGGKDAYFYESLLDIGIYDKKDYYIVKCDQIKTTRSKHVVELGPFYCLFDKDGHLQRYGDLGEQVLIKYSDENDCFIKMVNNRDDDSYDYQHWKLIRGKWKLQHTFVGIDHFVELSVCLLVFGMANGESQIYNFKTGEVVVHSMSECTVYYNNFANVELGKYRLITKKIEVGGLETTLQFFIDLKGNVVSDVVDIMTGDVYSFDYQKSQRVALEEIYRLVQDKLKRQVVSKNHIYQLQLRKVPDKKAEADENQE